MNSEQLQDRLDELSEELRNLEREQQSIPQQIADAVETFDREKIMQLRQRSGDIADELFDVRSAICKTRQEMLHAERSEIENELSALNVDIDELRKQISELEAKRQPLQAQANQLRTALERNRQQQRSAKRELGDLLWSEKQRLQSAASAFVAPSVKALNVGNNGLLAL